MPSRKGFYRKVRFVIPRCASFCIDCRPLFGRDRLSDGRQRVEIGIANPSCLLAIVTVALLSSVLRRRRAIGGHRFDEVGVRLVQWNNGTHFHRNDSGRSGKRAHAVWPRDNVLAVVNRRIQREKRWSIDAWGRRDGESEKVSMAIKSISVVSIESGVTQADAKLISIGLGWCGLNSAKQDDQRRGDHQIVFHGVAFEKDQNGYVGRTWKAAFRTGKFCIACKIPSNSRLFRVE